MTVWNTIRKEFPIYNTYVYLNPTGDSPITECTAKQAKLFYDEMLAYGDNLYKERMERNENTRNSVAKYIGADSHEVAFTTNSSQCMNIVALLNKEKGSVLTMKDEFPSSTFPWINLETKLN